ncbi:hypothetical protein KFE80_04175 [bacterium SCSIO 12696]|nr:hypothetical protein KFE80_04175 [bacterium SCSIO 12696]
MENNLYATPKSDISSSSKTVPSVLMYSPKQVACGTIGGPVGLIYFLAANFKAMGREDLRKKTLWLGISLIVVLIIMLPFLPDDVPSTPFTIAYIIIAYQVADKHQMTKQAIMDSESHDFHSNWKVLGLGLLCLLGSMIVLMGPLVVLMLTGIWNPV